MTELAISNGNVKEEDQPASNGQHVHADGSHELDYQPQLQVLPIRHTKVVHLVRHGEGFHNVAGQADHLQYQSYEWEDAHLTPFGWQQAHALHDHIAKLPEPLDVQVVICSPLTRTLETAVAAFGGGPVQPGDSSLPLMRQQPDRPGQQVAHAAVGAGGCPPFVAWEGCREHLGKHPCDRRRSITHYQQQFPAVDFSLILTDEDALWKEDERESKEEIRTRGAAFMAWLMARPEQRIAVVSHSSFLHFTMTNYGHSASPLVQGELHRWYENCEMRSVVLADAGGAGALDPAWFPGGHRLQRSASLTS